MRERQIGLAPAFAWSARRAELFATCPRKFYYRYYGMWLGWEAAADERTRLLYLLAKRTTLQAWVGLRIHRGFAALLRGTPLPAVLDRTRSEMRAEFRLSRARRFLEPGQARQFGLAEHYYGGEAGLADEEVRRHFGHVEACLAAFASSSYPDDVRQAEGAGRIVYVEPEDTADFEQLAIHNHGLGDFPVFAAPDLVVAYPNGTACVLDWKTGGPPKACDERISVQLAFEALWAGERLGVILGEAVEAFEVFWPGQEHAGNRLTSEDLGRALDFARASVAEMQSRLREPDTNLAEEDDFEARPGESRCATCVFRAVCPERAAPVA